MNSLDLVVGLWRLTPFAASEESEKLLEKMKKAPIVRVVHDTHEKYSSFS